jgi:hypothetical protein
MREYRALPNGATNERPAKMIGRADTDAPHRIILDLILPLSKFGVLALQTNRIAGVLPDSQTL